MKKEWLIDLFKYFVIGILLIFFFQCYGHTQNAYQVLKQISKGSKRALVCRTITTNVVNANLARNAALLRNTSNYSQHLLDCKIKINTEFSIPVLKKPESLYGGYNYLKILSTMARRDKFIADGYQRVWKNINNSTTYNGVHHIVNKSTLELIHRELKAKGLHSNVNLAEMQNNAPAIFHILHGNPEYKDIFHNSEYQLKMYHMYGIKGILEDFFRKMDNISLVTNYKIQYIPNFVKEGIMAEAELWAKNYNLKWE